MNFLEWFGIISVMIWLFIGLVYAFKNMDSQKKIIEDDYYKNELYNDFDEE